MKNSKEILKEPAFVLCLERHKDIRYFPTKERLNAAGFENVYPFSGIDGAGIVSGLESGNLDCFSQGLLEAAEYLFDVKLKAGHGKTYTAPGQFGVFASFLSIWRLIACSKVGGAFIFEDDALPRPDFKDVFSKYWDLLDGDEDIVFIGSGSISSGIKNNFKLIKNNMFYDGPVDCLHATYVTRKGAQKLLEIYSEFVDYDENDPLLENHIHGSEYTDNQSNMLWSNLCDYDLKDYIRSNDNKTAKYNLDIKACDEKSKLPSSCINKDNNLFYVSKPRISHNIYTADNFIGFIQTASELHWVTLREYHKKHCSNFKSAIFYGNAIPVDGEYTEFEVPWSLSSGLPSERDSGIIHQNAYQQSSIHGECLVDELSRTKKAIKANAASHIFLIGMERCGANSILEFLGTSIPIKFDSRGRMASRMVFNFFGAHKILEGLEEEVPSLCAYGNLLANFIAGDEKLSGTEQRHIPLNMFRLFKELYNQYPESKFIFNTRNIDHWLEGRRKIGDGYMMDYYQRCSSPDLAGTDQWREKTIEEVNADWRKSFINHREEVLDFFKDKDSSRFIEFNITEDHPEKIVEFLPELELNLKDAWEVRENWGAYIAQ